MEVSFARSGIKQQQRLILKYKQIDRDYFGEE